MSLRVDKFMQLNLRRRKRFADNETPPPLPTKHGDGLPRPTPDEKEFKETIKDLSKGHDD